MDAATIEELLDKMTLAEQVALLAGIDFWTTAPIEHLGIPAIKSPMGQMAHAAAAASSGASARRASRWGSRSVRPGISP